MSTWRFEIRDVARTGLPESCVDAVVSIDVLQLVEDHAAMLREAARVIKPTGRIVFITWEGRREAPARFPRDLAGLFGRAGLADAVVTEHPEWLERQFHIYGQAAVATADNDPALTDLAAEGRQWQPWRRNVRRVIVTATGRELPRSFFGVDQDKKG